LPYEVEILGDKLSKNKNTMKKLILRITEWRMLNMVLLLLYLLWSDPV